MLGLTSPGLQALTAIAAVLAIAAVAVLVTRRADTTRTPLLRRLGTRTAPVVALAVAAQALAVTTVGLAVNNSYGFYTSWSDLFGRTSGGATIRTGGLVAAGQGKVQVLTVHARVGGPNDRVLVWTPPQYDSPAYRAKPLPVVLFLPGQPNSPDGAFRHFDFGAIATRAIASGKVPPFVAVFPTLMIAPPRDTECTDVPGGPQAETWLERDVPAFVTSHFRVQPTGAGWSMMGWSTGGFCAAKLLLTHPEWYSSAASFGGYYQPLQDPTTGNLFQGRRALEDHNSPMWLYQHLQTHGGLRSSRLLLVAGRQDSETWPQTKAMLDLAGSDPAVAHLVFPRGGHNYRNYRQYLADVLAWSASAWPH
jgi:enterochelin esterase-like enzyme